MILLSRIHWTHVPGGMVGVAVEKDGAVHELVFEGQFGGIIFGDGTYL